ncbi:BTAD domain-containing putative transcriptional regulator [Nonomuraea sp. NPDC050663]|uniref:AfsR/SARP family transcriptional regulator n=1 Tax=Nonomuraea sp. NPDC050663 TaxID=3364370 RepID=UPI00378A950E
MFTLLGRLTVAGPGGEIVVGAAKQQAVLATLLLRQGRMTTIDRLIEELWEDGAPATARTSLQTYVYRLRRTLAPLEPLGVRLATRGSGYVLDIPDGALDTTRFERSAAAGAARLARNEPGPAAESLREALALWRGPLLPDADSAFVRQERARLAEICANTRELLLEADLRVGPPSRVIPDLERLVRAHPLRECLWATLIRAQAMAGRRGEALAAYRRVRDLLDDELGIEPSDELKLLQRAVLQGGLVPAGGASAVS